MSENGDLGGSGESRRPRQVAVIGAGSCEVGAEPWLLAEEVGGRLAQAGIAVVCGGLGGVMEAACRGAAGAGGTAIGIVPGDSVEEANPYCTQVVATGIGHARNLSVVSSGDAVIAVTGEWGTLSEIGYARAIGRPVVTLRSWTLIGRGEMEGAPGLLPVDSAEAAVAAVQQVLAPA